MSDMQVEVTRDYAFAAETVWGVLADFGDLSWADNPSTEVIGSGPGMIRRIRMPDPMLRTRPARVTRIHMPVPEPRIDPQRHLPPIPRTRQLINHPRRPDVRKHAMLQHHLQREGTGTPGRRRGRQ